MEAVIRTRNPRILVIARGHLGDIVAALPALRDLRAGHPAGHITLVANEYVRGALEGCPFVDEIIYGFGYRPRSRARTALLRLELLARMAGRYDIALALRASPRVSAALGPLTGAPGRVAGHPPGMSGPRVTHDLGVGPRV